MRKTPLRRVAVIATMLALAPAPAMGQDQPAASDSAAALAGELTATPASELLLRLAPLTSEELTGLSEAALAELQEFGAELATALIEQRRARDAKDTGADDLAALDSRVQLLLDRKAKLISRVETVLAAMKAKGGDVTAARLYVGVIQGLDQDDPSSASEARTRTDEEQPAAALDAAVGAAIAAVREQPPVHERPQPWTVPVRELELELMPLRLPQVEERVTKWSELLQREVRRRIRIDIALTRAEEPAERAELARRSAAQQEVVQAIVQRMQAVLLVLQKRGGDVSEHRKYIATATGQSISLSDPGLLYAQTLAWIKSREGGIRLGLNVLKALGVLLAFYLLSRILGKTVSTAVSRVPKASTLLRSFLVGGTRRLTMLIGLVIAVGMLGVNITPLIAAIGAAGLVIGLALQGTLSNFASGILILFYRPFDIGDAIKAAGIAGKVESMSLVSTSILTPDNQVLIVPNNQIWNGVITNITGRTTRRVDLVFGIGYGDDIGRAVTVLEEAMTSHEKVLADPPPVVKVSELADNSVNLIARPWARTSDYWDVYWDLMRTVKERFDAAGLNIPYPQRDLHVPGTIEVKLASDSLHPSSSGRDVSSAPSAGGR